MQQSDRQRAQANFAIQDVYICDASLWADRSYDPATAISDSNVQFKLSPTNECQIIAFVPPIKNVRYLVRYFVGTGLRILKADANPEKPDITRDDLLVEIQATFIARYAVNSEDQPTESMLAAFNDNAVHHVWPYWREFLQDAALRLRVPPVMLPMRISRPPTDLTVEIEPKGELAHG